MTKENNQLNNIVILGGGTAGWMTAAALCKLLPSNVHRITLIESNQIGTVGVGEATIPHLRFFNQKLGIDEAEFMRQTNATFKLGIEFSNWAKEGDAYIHPFGDYGLKINDIGFHHYWLQQTNQQQNHALDSYSLPIMACKGNKFEFPSDDLSSVGSTYSYAYHIDAGKYADFLRHYCEQRAVTRIEGKVIDVITRASNGSVDQLILESGERVQGDFFVDCSGFRAQLIGKVLNTEFEDWSHWLPCNKAIAVGCEGSEAPVPYTKAMATKAGWQWQIPLQNRTGNGHVYCDQFIDQQQAIDVLMQNLPANPINDPVYLSFQTGKRKVVWKNNCIGIGLSSGFLEPLESTSIYLIQSAIMKLVELFPEKNNMEIKARELNRYMNMEMERIRDFLILHYHATERTDTPFWQYCKNMDIPQSLKEKMEAFAKFGVIETYQHGLFLEPSWLAVYIGQGIIPANIDPRVTKLNQQKITSLLGQLRNDICLAQENMPSHQQVIKMLNETASTLASTPCSLNLYGRYTQ